MRVTEVAFTDLISRNQVFRLPCSELVFNKNRFVPRRSPERAQGPDCFLVFWFFLYTNVYSTQIVFNNIHFAEGPRGTAGGSILDPRNATFDQDLVSGSLFPLRDDGFLTEPWGSSPRELGRLGCLPLSGFFSPFVPVIFQEREEIRSALARFWCRCCEAAFEIPSKAVRVR